MGDGSAWSPADQTGGTSGWHLSGNAGTITGTNYLGTSDNRALELKVNAARASRFEPGSRPNLIGGYFGNYASPGVIGAVIAGGGGIDSFGTPMTIWVNANYGFSGGGVNKHVGNNDGDPSNAIYAAVVGGSGNTASGERSIVVGATAGGLGSLVAGGWGNTANGQVSAIGGGWNKQAGGQNAMEGGEASYWSV